MLSRGVEAEVAAWAARSAAAFGASRPVVRYHAALAWYFDKHGKWPWLGVLVRLARLCVIVLVGYVAWGLDLLALAGLDALSYWHYEYVAWAWLVAATVFAVSLPGFVVVRVVRGALLGATVVAVPLVAFGAYMWMVHGLNVVSPRAAVYTGTGWSQGSTIPWGLVVFGAGLHVAWLVLAGYLVLRAGAAIRVVVLLVLVPARLSLRLAVPVLVAWFVFEDFFGGLAAIVDWSSAKVEELAPVYPVVGGLVGKSGSARTVAIAGVGSVSGVIFVLAIWSVWDLVRICRAQFVSHVDGGHDTGGSGRC